MQNKICLITGATSGIGQATAMELLDVRGKLAIENEEKVVISHACQNRDRCRLR